MTDALTPDPMTAIAIYAETRAHLISQVRDLSIADSATIVPPCPAWSVSDVVAHVTGLVADLLAGRKPPLGTDEMTSRQVATRSDMSIRAICDEWAGNADGIAEFMGAHPRYAVGLTADLAVHCHDIAETLDAVQVPPAVSTATGCERYVPLLQERVAEQLDIALRVDLDGRVWEPTAGSTPVAMSGTPTEFLRSVTGRRTRAQVDGLFTWTGDGSAILDSAFMQYGPYRQQ